MRKYGLIHTAFWDREPFASLGTDAQHLWFYFLSSRHSTYLGCFYLPMLYMVHDLHWPEERVEKALEICKQHQLIHYEQSWVFIPEFLQWDPVENKNQWICLQKMLADVPQQLPFYSALLQGLIKHVKYMPEADQEELGRIIEQHSTHRIAQDSQEKQPSSPSEQDQNTKMQSEIDGHEKEQVEQQNEIGLETHYTTSENLEEKRLERVSCSSNPAINDGEKGFSEPFSKPYAKPKIQDPRTNILEPRSNNQEPDPKNKYVVPLTQSRPLSVDNSPDVKSFSQLPPFRSAKKQNLAADVGEIFQHWQIEMHHPQAKLDDKRKHVIQKALKSGYNVAQLCAAISGCAKTPFNMGDNEHGQRYDSLTLILRDGDHIDRFIHNYHCPPQAKSKADKILEENIKAAKALLAEEESQ